MQFGMPSLLEYDDFHSQLECCRALNLDILELNMSLPGFTTSQIIMDEFIDQVFDMERMLGIHLPENLDIAEFNPEIRQGALQLIRTVATHYDHDKVRHMVMHMRSGTYFKLPQKRTYLYDKYRDQYLKHFQNGIHALQDVFEYSEIQLLIENTGNFHFPFIQDALEIALSYDFVGLVWDIGHDAKSGYKDRELIEKHIDRLKLMHIHDSDGTVDHLPLYSGSLDIDQMLTLSKERDIPAIIEVKTREGLLRSCTSLAERGYNVGRLTV